MAYCPQCGREQKCGCEVCHHCGVPLVDEGYTSSKAVSTAASLDEEISRHVTDDTAVARKMDPDLEVDAEEEKAREASCAVLPTLLLILGCGVLLIALIEVIHSTSDFMGAGGGASGVPAVKHVGYYLGHLLYNSSVRFLIGFALTAAGLFYSPPLPFKKRDNWRRAVVVLGASMSVVGLCCLLSAILILIPGSLSLLVRDLLPSPATSVSVFLVMGVSLLAGSYVINRRLRGPGRRFTFLKVSRKQR
jgi:hypothetical protein